MLYFFTRWGGGARAGAAFCHRWHFVMGGICPRGLLTLLDTALLKCRTPFGRLDRCILSRNRDTLQLKCNGKYIVFFSFLI